jgi:hypothetical protein
MAITLMPDFFASAASLLLSVLFSMAGNASAETAAAPINSRLPILELISCPPYFENCSTVWVFCPPRNGISPRLQLGQSLSGLYSVLSHEANKKKGVAIIFALAIGAWVFLNYLVSDL